MKKILFTGGSGRFAKIFKLKKNNFLIDYPKRKKFNIESLGSMQKYIKKNKPDYLIHCAGLSRPMNIHEKNISNSISTNIIGTSNVVKICSQYNIRLQPTCTSFATDTDSALYSALYNQHLRHTHRQLEQYRKLYIREVVTIQRIKGINKNSK